MCWQAAGRVVLARSTGWCTVSRMKPSTSFRLDTTTEVESPWCGPPRAYRTSIHSNPRLPDPWRHENAPMLVASVVMMGAAVLGARVVFSMPLDIKANWIFRVMPIRGAADCMVASRRALYMLSVVPVFVTSSVLFLWMWPWRPAAGHLAVLGLLGAILAELCLGNFHKIPFTCSYLPGRSYAHMAFLGFVGIMVVVGKGAEVERRALGNPAGLATMLALLGIAALCARWRTTASAKSPEGSLQFEEAPDPVILSLGLNRDGATSYPVVGKGLPIP